VTDPVSPEREADYHNWYNKRPDTPFLAMPGITRVTRYRNSATQLNRTVAVPHRFMALYEIEVADMAVYRPSPTGSMRLIVAVRSATVHREPMRTTR